jgi:hypothetical protein
VGRTNDEGHTKEGDKSDDNNSDEQHTRLGHVKSGSLRGGNFSGRAAFAYRVEKSSGPETYQNAPERRVPEWNRDRTHNRAGLEAACSETVKGELPDVPSMFQ